MSEATRTRQVRPGGGGRTAQPEAAAGRPVGSRIGPWASRGPHGRALQALVLAQRETGPHPRAPLLSSPAAGKSGQGPRRRAAIEREFRHRPAILLSLPEAPHVPVWTALGHGPGPCSRSRAHTPARPGVTGPEPSPGLAGQRSTGRDQSLGPPVQTSDSGQHSGLSRCPHRRWPCPRPCALTSVSGHSTRTGPFLLLRASQWLRDPGRQEPVSLQHPRPSPLRTATSAPPIPTCHTPTRPFSSGP